MPNKPRIAFFGTPRYAAIVLDELHAAGMTPELVVTQPDKPKGKGLALTPPPAKEWAITHGVPVIQPATLKDDSLLANLSGFDVFVVIAYGKIIPQAILDLPKHGALNIHGSLLPKYRGASPIESAILADDRDAGVSIIKMDAEMDHGPIVADERVSIDAWPPTAPELGNAIVSAGAKLLVRTLPDYLAGKIDTHEQDHAAATYTKKIEKSDGEIDLAGDPYKNFLKIQAFAAWPGAYFFAERNGKRMRVIVKKAAFEGGSLRIVRVVPEGKREMDYADFIKQA